jgi:hypothetical protein
MRVTARSAGFAHLASRFTDRCQLLANRRSSVGEDTADKRDRTDQQWQQDVLNTGEWKRTATTYNGRTATETGNRSAVADITDGGVVDTHVV